ncbi:TTYH2 isoform 10, partial [Pongo abelii]
ALTTMQIQVAGLLQFAVPLFSTAEEDLLAIQLLLNSSESSLHQLTAMVDCRGLHKAKSVPFAPSSQGVLLLAIRASASVPPSLVPCPVTSSALFRASFLVPSAQTIWTPLLASATTASRACCTSASSPSWPPSPSPP